MKAGQTLKRSALILAVVCAATCHAGSARADLVYNYAYKFGASILSRGGAFGVAIDPNSGNAFVADLYNNRVAVFSNDGTYLRSFGSPGRGNGQFLNPFSVAIDAAGNVFATDFSNDRVEEFTNSGTFIRTFGSSGSGDGQFIAPRGLAVDTSGNVFVVDSHNSRIVEFNSAGTFVRAIGTSGAGQLGFLPFGLAVDAAGNLFVGDTRNDASRIVEFTNTGTFVRAFDILDSNGRNSYPTSLALDAAGNIFVAAGANENIKIYAHVLEFTNNGTLLQVIGSTGSGNGQFFSSSFGVAFDSSGKLFASDGDNNRVEVFTPSGAAPEPGTLGMAATGAVIALGAYARRRRRAAAA